MATVSTTNVVDRFIGIMSLGGMRPDDALALSLAARVFQIVVWMPWWLMLVARTGALRPPSDSVTPEQTPSERAASPRRVATR